MKEQQLEHRHIKNVCKKMIDLKQIAVVCTDGASIYTGKINRIIVQMKKDDDFNFNVIGLGDMCHKLEILIFNRKFEWLCDLLEKSSNIVNIIKNHNFILETLHNCEKFTNKHFFALQNIAKTRFVEYSHKHLDSILKNLAILTDNEGLPKVINSEDCDHYTSFEARRALEILSHPVFIARLILVNKVCFDIAAVEKTVQSINFNPFDYMKCINDLKLKLKSLTIHLEKLNF